MRKTIFLMTLMLLACNTMWGQFKVGIKAGVNANVVNANLGYMENRTYNSQFQYNIGTEVGVPMQYQFLDFLALRWEVALQMREDLYQNGRYYYDIQRNLFVDVPVMLSFGFGGENIRGFVNIGGYIGGWVAGWDVMSLYPKQGEKPQWLPEDYHYFNDSENRLDGGLLAGIGISWLNDHFVSMSLEYRYYLGLTSRWQKISTGNYYVKDMPMSLCLAVHFKTNKNEQ